MMNNKEVIDYINKIYDIDENHNNKIDNDYKLNPFNKITAIIGGSGTGKTVLMKKLFKTDDVTFKVNDEKCITTLLYEKKPDIDEIFNVLFNCGLSSVPVWKQPFSTLSNGEKLRFEIAYKLLDDSDIFYIDEFTSMLDRQTAENLCINIDKLLKKYNKSMVFTSCHYDVLNWMQVDEVYDTNLKKCLNPQVNRDGKTTNWRFVMFQKICGEYSSTITI